MSGVEKLREGICPGWKNDWREHVRVSKMMGRIMCGREFVRDSWQDRDIARLGISL